MQDCSPPLFTAPSLSSYCEDKIGGEIGEELRVKLKLDVSGETEMENLEIIHEIRSEDQDQQQLQNESDDDEEFRVKLKINVSGDNETENSEILHENKSEDQVQEELQSESDDEEEDDDEEFSFVCSVADETLIAAEDAFSNGQIRPIYPLFDRDLLLDDEESPPGNQLSHRPPVKKVFMESRDPPTPATETDEIATGPFCTWSKKAVELSPEVCKKSNSTGFSKLWRFRDLLHRSNSDSRDAYVFFDGSNTAATSSKVEKIDSSPLSEKKAKAKVTSAGAGAGTGGEKVKGKKVVKKGTTPLSAHELHYVRNRALKEEDRRRSYLPYRPEVVGFFTNVNGGLSRNVHPF